MKFFKLIDNHENFENTIFGYEDGIRDYLIDNYNDINQRNWRKSLETDEDFILEEYPYYLENSEETVLIQNRSGDIHNRPLMVKGMGRHDEKSLERIREKVYQWKCPECDSISDNPGICRECGTERKPITYGVFNLKEIAKIEGWE